MTRGVRGAGHDVWLCDSGGAVFVNIESASPLGGLIVDVGGSSGPPNPAVTAELGTSAVAVDLPRGRP